MPKKPVSDPITDQEMAFARLVLSGTMNDRQAAEAVNLNPDSAAYTKSKPRVRAYMAEHQAAVKERLVNQEADRLRTLNLGRNQILTRLWELANLSPEATRGSIAGQIKALSMIVAIEGLIPDRRLSPSRAQPTAPPVKAQIYTAAWLREQQQPAADEKPAEPAASTPTEPVDPQVPEPILAHGPNQLNPCIVAEPLNRVPAATSSVFHTASPVRPLSTRLGSSAWRR